MSGLIYIRTLFHPRRGGGFVTCSPSEQVQNCGLLPLPQSLGFSTSVSSAQVQDTGGLLSEHGDGRDGRDGGVHLLSSSQVQEVGLFPLPQSLGSVTEVPFSQVQDETVDPGQGLFPQFTPTMATKNNQRKIFMTFKSSRILKNIEYGKNIIKIL